MTNEPIQTFTWDILDHLQTEEDRTAYLQAVLEDGDPTLINTALDDIARAMTDDFHSRRL